MKQSFNIGVAECYGVDAAIIVSLMIDFCKCCARCMTHKEDGKVFVYKSVIKQEVSDYMPIRRFNKGCNILLDNEIIEGSEDGKSYAFTHFAKRVLSKDPMRITITWQ